MKNKPEYGENLGPKSFQQIQNKETGNKEKIDLKKMKLKKHLEEMETVKSSSDNLSADFVKKLSEIYNDITGIKLNPTDSLITLMNKFYDVMRKHGIKQGNWTENGSRTICTAEWNFCFNLFKNHKILAYDLWLILNEPPQDLLAYGPKPKLKKAIK